MAKGSKQKVRKLLGLIFTFPEVTDKNLIGRAFLPYFAYFENALKSLTETIFLKYFTKRHNLVQLVFKSNFALLKFIYFQFQTLNKQMMVFFRTRLRKILIWQTFS